MASESDGALALATEIHIINPRVSLFFKFERGQCLLWVIRVGFAMSEPSLLSPQQRRYSGHRGTSPSGRQRRIRDVRAMSTYPPTPEVSLHCRER
jgi:hypothetical protein